MEYQQTNLDTVPTSTPTCQSGEDQGAGYSSQAGQTLDNQNILWNVRKTVPTKHGFPLLFGSRFKGFKQVMLRPGRSSLIATPALVAYLERHRGDRQATFDLPTNPQVIMRVYKDLGLHLRCDPRALELERTPELRRMNRAECAKHFNVSPKVISEWKNELQSRKSRPKNWWHDPAVLALLRNPALTARMVSLAVGVSATQVQRLRCLALRPSLEVTTAPKFDFRSVWCARKKHARDLRFTGQHVTDVEGVLWDVYQIRPSRYGFNVLLGLRAGGIEGRHAINARLIPTVALMAHLRDHRADPKVRMDLPVAHNTIYRLLQRHGQKPDQEG